MTTETFRRADHRPVPTSAHEAEASAVALRAPSEASASCCFPLDITHSPSRRRLSKEIVGRGTQFGLGLGYNNGRGVPQDFAQAAAWYRQAADQGVAEAQHNLGVMYANGEGVAQDLTQAVAWYRQAADQGLAAAQDNLGGMYATGRGVPQNYVEAHKWRNLAASRATGDTQKEYAEARDALAKVMTPAQLAEAQRLAREWQAAFEKRQAE